MYILPRAFHTLVHCSDDKFSVVTRIQKHLSWDDLHIWAVKLRGRGRVYERKGEKWRIVIIAIISRLSTEWWSAMKVQRRPKYGKCGAEDTTRWCGELKMITDARQIQKHSSVTIFYKGTKWRPSSVGCKTSERSEASLPKAEDVAKTPWKSETFIHYIM